MSLKILWFDDDINKLSSHINYLRHKKIEITEVALYLDALKVCDKEIEKFSCIIVDIRVLHENEKNIGIIFISQLLDKYRFTKPIIVFTVLDKKNDLRLLSFLKKTNVFYFQKGVTVKKLYEFIKEVMTNA